VDALPRVFSGGVSFVGLPLPRQAEQKLSAFPVSMNGQAASLGPYGLTGIVQIQPAGKLESEEVEQLKLYYAKNQSLKLDIEILMKTVLGRKSRS
jgi:lipopolysaccharide/colanic/teichoic acid biosynthesis glycosyltransferase